MTDEKSDHAPAEMHEKSEREPAAVPKTIVIGEIVGTFGHRGEVKIYPHTDFPERLTESRSFTLRLPNGSEKEYRVIRSRFHKNVVVSQLAGVPTMSDAEALRGSLLVIAPGERVELPEDAYYIDDLIGLRVRTDDGQELGTIRDVLKYPANDVYDLGHLLIPAIGEVVQSIDLEAGLMIIHPIPGLLDEPETA